MSTPESKERAERIAAALEQNASPREARLNALLDEVERVTEWSEATSLPPEVRSYFASERAKLAEAVAVHLLAWRRAGGGVRLVAGDEAGAAPPARGVLALAPALGERSDANEGSDAAAPVTGPHASAPPADDPLDFDPLEDDPPTDRIPDAKPPPKPTLPPASFDALASLKAHVEGGGGFRVQAPPADWPERVAEYLRELLPGKDPEAELVAVTRVVEAVDKWRNLPPEAQAALVGLLAARLRAVQEVSGFLGDKRIDYAFGTLSAYMKRARPGFVYGLARWHTPMRGTWEADAEAQYERLATMVPTPKEAEPNQQRHLDGIESLVKELETCPVEVRSAVAATLRRNVSAAFGIGIQARNPRLVRILANHGDELEGPEFRTLRRAIRDEAEEASAEADEETGGETHLPEEWAWWPFTRGARALIIGGDQRELSRQRLERAFGFSELEWVGAEYKRNNLQGVRERVRAGKTDLVILLTRFTGHDADQIIIPACREMNVPFVCVQHGYGVVRVRHAIERFLDPKANS